MAYREGEKKDGKGGAPLKDVVIEDARDLPLSLHDSPMTDAEIAFWKSVYVACVALRATDAQWGGPMWAEAADKAVVRLRRRVAWGK